MTNDKASGVPVWREVYNTGHYDRMRFGDATNGHPVDAELGTWIPGELAERDEARQLQLLQDFVAYVYGNGCRDVMHHHAFDFMQARRGGK